MGVLDGRRIVITGASAGIGEATALALAADGAAVALGARRKDRIDDLARRIEAGGGRAVAIEADVGDEAQARAMIERAAEQLDGIDGLINNAGIAPAGRFEDQDPAVWKETMAVNVIAPMLLAQAAGRYMIEQGGGRIVNIASTTGVRGKPHLVGYSTSKGAVVRFTEALAGEWAAKNVQVNCIAPGAFRTEAQKAVTDSEELLRRRVSKIPAGRMADPSEIVPLACLLVSPLSSFTTGAIFVIDGGESGKL